MRANLNAPSARFAKKRNVNIAILCLFFMFYTTETEAFHCKGTGWVSNCQGDFRMVLWIKKNNNIAVSRKRVTGRCKLGRPGSLNESFNTQPSFPANYFSARSSKAKALHGATWEKNKTKPKKMDKNGKISGTEDEKQRKDQLERVQTETYGAKERDRQAETGGEDGKRQRGKQQIADG